MAVDGSQVDSPARAAAGAVHVEPWRSGDQRRPDRWRPQHVSAGGKLLIPAIDDGLRLGARSGIGHLPLGLDIDVEPARPWREYPPGRAAIQVMDSVRRPPRWRTTPPARRASDAQPIEPVEPGSARSQGAAGCVRIGLEPTGSASGDAVSPSPVP